MYFDGVIYINNHLFSQIAVCMDKYIMVIYFAIVPYSHGLYTLVTDLLVAELLFSLLFQLVSAHQGLFRTAAHWECSQ